MPIAEHFERGLSPRRKPDPFRNRTGATYVFDRPLEIAERGVAMPRLLRMPAMFQGRVIVHHLAGALIISIARCGWIWVR